MIEFLVSVVPWWVWLGLAGVIVGLAWRVLGWQGMLAGLVAVLTLGAYRQGRLGGQVLGRRHDVNRDDIVVGVETAPPRKRRAVVDWFRR